MAKRKSVAASRTAKKVAQARASTKASQAKKASKAKKARRPAAKTTSAQAKTTAKTASNAKKTASKVKKTIAKRASKPKPPKSPLTKKEIKEYREMLLAKRRTLLGDMTGMQAEALRGNNGVVPDHSSMPVHMADIGTDNYEQEFTLGLLESERQLLREIDEALERIALGTYGVCMGTGASIGKPRLTAKPWARYAIDYVRRIEQGQVRVPALDYGLSGGDDDEDDDQDDDSDE